ncbi:MAG: hypothetical protein R2750_10540 [Bacteroidales bacterium]
MKRLLILSASIFIMLILSSCIEESDPFDLPDDRDVFLGIWDVSESCSKDFYSVEIIKDPSNSAQVIIKNFGNTGSCSNPPYGIVAGSSLFVPTQSICSDLFEVNGDGTLNKNKITWQFTINDGADLYTCSATYTKQ